MIVKRNNIAGFESRTNKVCLIFSIVGEDQKVEKGQDQDEKNNSLAGR